MNVRISRRDSTIPPLPGLSVTTRKLHHVLPILIALLALSPGGLIAQDTEDAPSPAAADEDDSPASPDAENSDSDETKEKPLREQTIYIPYSKLRGIFEKEGRGVFIPYEQFQILWRIAREQTPDNAAVPGPPVDALITEISSEAVVEDEVVRVTATLNIELLGEGWHGLPIGLKDTAILSAKLADEPARIVPDGNNGYKLLIDNGNKKSSTHIATIEYARAFTKSPGRNMVSLAAPTAPVNKWRVRVPQAGVKVNIFPMIATTTQPGDDEKNGEQEEEETVVLAFVGAAPTVRIDWTPRSEGASGMAALATAETHQQLSIEEGIIRAGTQVQYSIRRAELPQLQISVPKEYKVTNVLDANVRGWTVEDSDETQEITVDLFEPAKGKQSVLVELERFISEDISEAEIEAPTVRAIGVGRQHGLIVVQLADSLRAEVTNRTGLLQLDAAELPAQLKNRKWEFAYRFSSLPTKLTMSLAKVEPRIHATQQVDAVISPEQVNLYATFTYDIRRAGIFQLALEIPTNYEVRSVRGASVPGGSPVAYDSHQLDKENGQRLSVQLAAKAIGKVGLTVHLQKRLDDPNLLVPSGEASDIDIPIPRVAADSVTHLTGKLVIHAPESLRTNPSAEGLQSIALAEAGGRRFPQSRPILAYAHADGPASLVLATQRRKPQITAKQLLQANVTAGAVEYRARFFFEILYSGVGALRIDVPAALAASIRNETRAMQDTRMEPQPDDVPEGYEAWQFAGETELLGNAEIVLTWDEKLNGLGIGKSKDVRIPKLKPADVDRAWGQIVIGKAETLDVRSTGETASLRPIDPQTDLMNGVKIADAARAFEFHDDWDLTITATRYELEDVKHTSIERAVARMVVGADSQTSVQALYRMRSARQRIEIKLPGSFDSARGFSQNPLRINGRPVPLERGDSGGYYVPLSDQTPEQTFVLELRYSVTSDENELVLPEFPDDPAIQKSYICVYLPNDQAMIGAHGPWDNELAEKWRSRLGGFRHDEIQDSQLVNWVVEGISMSGSPTRDFQTQGRLYTFATAGPPAGEAGALRLTTIAKDTLDAIIFLLIAIPGVVLVTQKLSVRVFAVGMVLFGLVFASIFLPSLSLHLFDYVLFLALFLVIAVWLLMGLMRMMRRPHKPKPQSAAGPPDFLAKESVVADSGSAAISPPEEGGLFGNGGVFGWGSGKGGQRDE